jgi:Protein of unknown function (DUF998)
VRKKPSAIVVIAAACCFIACIGDFTVTFLIGYFYRGYNFLTQSESYLGNADSPVAIYMSTWGVIFSLLFIVYAFALRKTIFSKGSWQLVGVWLIVIYGLGEGVGSGLFPYNHISNELTLSGKLHSIFSAIGDLAMVLLPFVILKIFPKQLFPKLNFYAWFAGISGPVLIIIFLLARQNIIPMKGLWQRLFLLDYYLLMMAVAVIMLVNQFRINSMK